MTSQFLETEKRESRVAYFSTYSPRQCGIATFTKDLISSIDQVNGLKQSVIAINEKGALYAYGKRVRLSIGRDSPKDYVGAAEYINSSGIDLVNLQHEFGLFGGEYGEFITIFLEKINKPVITTLHTVQQNFNPKALEVLRKITDKSAAIVVIAHSATKILRQQGILCKNFVTIPHGCPDIQFIENNESVKESVGLGNRFVASTFGLISSGKGIEYAIRALPTVVKKEPRMLYLIVGQTHPEVRKQEGEKYRNKLMKIVNELGLDEHVRFDNRFLTKLELIKYLQATDIYITPYNSPDQISSGTLTYALGAGKAVVSTPYLHAQETLANNRGIFCRFKDPDSISRAIIKLLDEKLRRNIQKRAYKYSRRFVWTTVAKQYIQLFKKVIKNNESP
jgi:polysaccharide biosynthesis protein PslF